MRDNEHFIKIWACRGALPGVLGLFAEKAKFVAFKRHAKLIIPAFDGS